MKKLMMIVALVAIALGSTGCFHNKVIMSPDYDPAATEPDAEAISFHLFGILALVGGSVDLDEVCPAGAGVVEDRLFIAGIGQTRIFCKNTAADAGAAVAPEVAALDN